MPKKRAPADKGEKKRSPCPVACLLDIMGDRWTLLVVRDLFLGKTRFKEFSTSPEGIPTNILSDRLNRLLNRKIIKQIPLTDSPKRLAYELTEKGTDLGSLLREMCDWGLKWEEGTMLGLQNDSLQSKKQD